MSDDSQGSELKEHHYRDLLVALTEIKTASNQYITWRSVAVGLLALFGAFVGYSEWLSARFSNQMTAELRGSEKRITEAVEEYFEIQRGELTELLEASAGWSDFRPGVTMDLEEWFKSDAAVKGVIMAMDGSIRPLNPSKDAFPFSQIDISDESREALIDLMMGTGLMEDGSSTWVTTPNGWLVLEPG